MDLTYVGYILFVIPGFTLVWTHRHFTKAKSIGEFEYAAWSFLSGVVLFFLVFKIMDLQHKTLPLIPINDPGALLGSLLGICLGTTASSFPLGFLGALISHLGLFGWIDKKLFLFRDWFKENFF